ncbi:MAG: SDR family oxidoreductase [Candidatus Rokubacteria bacterium]|nr:SDR family oxidoreductase [Candidatus Rokubacteria bacterium]
METGLRGKVAMVSGASKGIGRAVAEKLAAEGASLSLCARSSEALRTVAQALEAKHGVPALAVPADLSRGDDIQRWVAATLERFRGVDILINNAGAAQGGPFLRLPDQAWLDGWQLKLFGYIRVAREVFPHLVTRGRGHIVNVIGIAGVQPMENYMIGGAANAALLNFTKALADEGAPHGILVTGVNPGPIRTDRWDGIVVKWGAAKGVTPAEAERDILRGVPLRRPGTPDEVANLVVFLASDLSTYITGTTIAIDGGMTRTIVG